MFRTTFLGHQGWFFRTERTNVLVDALLGPTFATYGGAVQGYEVHPPRDLDFASFPPIDAAIISHEHEDHFDIPSLNKLDRKVKVFLSGRSSAAAAGIIKEMGFTLERLEPGHEVVVGDLAFLPMSPDHVHFQTQDELDVLPFCIRDTSGDGSFFSSIDVPETEKMWRTLRSRLRSPGIWSYTHNAGDWSFQFGWQRPKRRGTQQMVQRVFAASEKLRGFWERPQLGLLCGSGTAYAPPLDFINHNTFHVDLDKCAEALKHVAGDLPFRAPLPGATFVMKGGAFVAEEEAGFVRPKPRSEWRSREYRADVRAVNVYPPACGEKRFRREDAPELRVLLSALASHLFGGKLFRELYSIEPEEVAPRRPTFALVLLADEEGGAMVFEYAPQACAFVPAQTSAPMRDYFAGFECWATDLLALGRVRFAPSNMVYGHCRAWNAAPHKVDFDFGYALRGFLHPLGRPQQYRALYDSVLSLEKKDAPRLRAARESVATSAVAPDFIVGEGP